MATSRSNILCLRAGVMGSISAWLPSRRSVDSQRGACVIRFAGQVRSGRLIGGNARYRLKGIGLGCCTGTACGRVPAAEVVVVIEGPRCQGLGGRTHAELRSEEADPDLAGLAAATEEEQRGGTRSICHPATIAHIAETGHPHKLLARRPALRHPGQMPLVRVSPDDLDQVAAVAGILDAARLVDDPDAHPTLVAALASEMRYGWDLQPDEHFLYLPDGADTPVATLAIDLPKRDNLQLFWLRLRVHPPHRRRGHGTAVMAEVLRMAKEAGRSILWV